MTSKHRWDFPIWVSVQDIKEQNCWCAHLANSGDMPLWAMGCENQITLSQLSITPTLSCPDKIFIIIKLSLQWSFICPNSAVGVKVWKKRTKISPCGRLLICQRVWVFVRKLKCQVGPIHHSRGFGKQVCPRYCFLRSVCNLRNSKFRLFPKNRVNTIIIRTSMAIRIIVIQI